MSNGEVSTILVLPLVDFSNARARRGAHCPARCARAIEHRRTALREHLSCGCKGCGGHRGASNQQLTPVHRGLPFVLRFIGRAGRAFRGPSDPDAFAQGGPSRRSYRQFE